MFSHYCVFLSVLCCQYFVKVNKLSLDTQIEDLHEAVYSITLDLMELYNRKRIPLDTRFSK